MNMGSDGRERGAAVWLRRIVVLGVALVVNLQGWCRDYVGMDPNAFLKQEEMIMDSLQDLVSHFDKGEKDYENDFGEICFQNWQDLETYRIALKDSENTKIIRFMGDLAGIEMHMGSHRYELYYAPALASCRELCEIVSNYKGPKENLYSYWCIYNIRSDLSSYVIGRLLDLEMKGTIPHGMNWNEWATEYVKEHPKDEFSRNYKIYQDLDEQESLLYGILKEEQRLAMPPKLGQKSE